MVPKVHYNHSQDPVPMFSHSNPAHSLPCIYTKIHFLNACKKDESKYQILHKIRCLVRSTEWSKTTQPRQISINGLNYSLQMDQNKTALQLGCIAFLSCCKFTFPALTDPSMSLKDYVRNFIFIANNAYISVNSALLIDNSNSSAYSNVWRVVWNHDLESVVNCDRRCAREEVLPNDCQVVKFYIKKNFGIIIKRGIFH
jgi:hypothetical protein